MAHTTKKLVVVALFNNLTILFYGERWDDDCNSIVWRKDDEAIGIRKYEC